MSFLLSIPIFKQLLILMVVIWAIAVLLRRIGLPTIMGELIAGIIIGPAVLGLIEPNEIIDIDYRRLFNEHWIYPKSNEKPLGASKIEDSCYW